MGGTLIVWKAPHPVSEEDAVRLLAGYYATGDESAFEPSPDVRAFHDELLGRWPSPDDADGGVPTWSSSPEQSDRVVCLDYSWSAPGELLDDIDRLARLHQLVLYDPQGPSLHVPGVDAEPPPVDAREVARVAAIGLGAIGVAVAAWYLSIFIVSWVVLVIAGFMAVAAVGTLVHYAVEARRHR
jgi:hypothetical protein